MSLSSIWRRLTTRRRHRGSFYDTQEVMRRAIEREADREAEPRSGVEPERDQDPSGIRH